MSHHGPKMMLILVSRNSNAPFGSLPDSQLSRFQASVHWLPAGANPSPGVSLCSHMGSTIQPEPKSYRT